MNQLHFRIPAYAEDFFVLKQSSTLTEKQRSLIDNWVNDTFGLFFETYEFEPLFDPSPIYFSEEPAFGTPTFVVDVIAREILLPVNS